MNRGKDSWNKAMLVNQKGKSSPVPTKKIDNHPVSSVVLEDIFHEPDFNPGDTRREEARVEKSVQINQETIIKRERQIKKEEEVDKNTRNGATPSMMRNQAAMERNMRSSAQPLARRKKANAIGNKQTDGYMQARSQRKTPLQEFNVSAFFEENLFEIIDLEENRSGICEFEDAVKWDE